MPCRRPGEPHADRADEESLGCRVGEGQRGGRLPAEDQHESENESGDHSRDAEHREDPADRRAGDEDREAHERLDDRVLYVIRPVSSAAGGGDRELRVELHALGARGWRCAGGVLGEGGGLGRMRGWPSSESTVGRSGAAGNQP